MAERARIRTVGLVVHSGRPSAVRAGGALQDWLRANGVTTRCLDDEPVAADERCAADRFAEGLDLVLSVGGDGTLLRAAQLAGPADVPLLGVKVGHLGFLTEIDPDEAPDLLTRLLHGTMLTENRLALVAEPGHATSHPRSLWALNEVILEKSARHRLITVKATVGAEHVTTFSADGVMVATPTGSTAYSFSARGPVISPKVPCILLTPVSPHMVFDRSIVLGAEEEVTLEVLGDEPGLLSADGQAGPELPVGSKVLIRAAPRPARLVRREGSPTFFALLREKFSLPGAAPHGDVGV